MRLDLRVIVLNAFFTNFISMLLNISYNFDLINGFLKKCQKKSINIEVLNLEIKKTQVSYEMSCIMKLINEFKISLY